MWEELLARDFEQPAFWRFHRKAVDIYSLQHPAVLCESAKSLAAHLCGLCVAMEMSGDQAVLSGVQRWLSSNPRIAKPALPASRGARTIADAYGLDDPASYGEALEEWGHSVWAAYSDLHAIAREWIAHSQTARPHKP
jgi:hypothetical protein